MVKNEFEAFRDFILIQIPKALKVLMDGYNVASGNTNQPCGYIFKRIKEVEQNTVTILNKLNVAATGFSTTTTSATAPWQGSTTTTSALTWQGGFAQFFGSSTTGGQGPPAPPPDVSGLQ